MSCLNAICCADYKGNFEEIKAFFAKENVPFEVFSGKIQGSRIRSKLAVRGNAQNPLIGLFKPFSHDVYEIPCCALHHEKINQAVKLIKLWMKNHHIEPYSENGHRGLLRYIQCVVERHSSKVQISFVLNDSSMEFENALSDLIQMAPSDFLHSLWINYNSTKKNTIFGSEWKLIFGEKWINERIASVPVCYLPGSFGQANLEMFEKLVESIKNKIPSKKRVGEFYAGVGVIGLAVAQKSESVILTEINPDSELCFNEMRSLLPSEIKDKISYLLTKADNALEVLKAIDIALVDPPRKGLDKSFIRALNASNVEMLVYVSCGWPSLIRDLSFLKEKGWKITNAEGYLFFPGTPHLETLCILQNLNCTH